MANMLIWLVFFIFIMLNSVFVYKYFILFLHSAPYEPRVKPMLSLVMQALCMFRYSVINSKRNDFFFHSFFFLLYWQSRTQSLMMLDDDDKQKREKKRQWKKGKRSWKSLINNNMRFSVVHSIPIKLEYKCADTWCYCGDADGMREQRNVHSVWRSCVSSGVT